MAVRDVAKPKQGVKDAQLIAAIVEYSEDAIVGSTLDGIITSWNPAAERMYGYSSEEIIGKSGNLLAPEDRADEFRATVTTVKEGEAVGHFETTGVRRDGSLIPVSLTVAPIHDEDGAIVGASAVHRDVTGQRRAFDVGQRMEAIVESSDDAIIGRTLEGIITSWNPAAERMYGYSSEEVVGKSIDRLTPEHLMAETGAVVAKVRAGQRVERLETVGVRKDGAVFPASVTISPIRDADGAIIGASAVHRDVTEQRRAFEVGQRMEAIVESSDDAIIAITLEGIVTSWNPAAERLFGYTTEEIIGKSAEAVTPEDRPDEMTDILAKVKAGKHIDHLETIRVRKDGAVFPVSLTVSPICDADGATVGASMISRDMAELKHAVRYARSLIEAALDPLVTISPEGKITDVNEATIKVTGVLREALIGSDFSQYFTDPDKAHEGYARAFAEGSLIDYPLTLTHQDGTLIHVLYNASVYRDFNENVLGVLAVARDSSKLRQQQQLSEQLREALESRIVIEQAKGITAQRHGVTIDQAYQRIRAHARNSNASLRTVAQAIVQVGLQV
jgi:PAS domain S-box-containing protein